jgi:hypothetical protein
MRTNGGKPCMNAALSRLSSVDRRADAVFCGWAKIPERDTEPGGRQQIKMQPQNEQTP